MWQVVVSTIFHLRLRSAFKLALLDRLNNSHNYFFRKRRIPTFFLHFSYMFPTCFLHVSYIFTPFFSHIFSLHCSDLRPGAVWNSSWPRRLVIFHGNLLGYTVDGPAKSKSPVENGGLSDPMIYKVSTILLVVQDFATIYCSSIRWCYNHWNEHVFFIEILFYY
jgi:hypothetical protein